MESGGPGTLLGHGASAGRGRGEAGAGAGAGAGLGHGSRRHARRPRRRGRYTFVLNAELVERARREVEERDVVRSIEAALAAAIDYQLWVRETARGDRDILS
jgi:hypothetical protein